MRSPDITYCFKSAVVTTLRFQLCSARYTALQMKNSRRRLQEVPLQQSNHHENMTIRTPQTINYCLESAVAYVQPVTKHHKRRTVLESNLQSPQKIRTIPLLQMYCREAMHRATAFGCQQKKWDTKEDKGKSMMRALYILQYAKRHISGRSNIEQ